MRFTKIPLIATLMAVALSLLIVLPALGQTSGYDDTRGTLASGSNLHVFVLDDDAADVVRDTSTLPRITGGVADTYFNGNLYVSNNPGKDDPETDAVERKGAAHNRVKIETTTTIVRKEFEGADGVLANRDPDGDGTPDDDTTTATVNEANYANDNFACDAKATVVNNNSGRKITVWLDDPNTDVATAVTAGATAAMSAIFEVISSGDEKRDGFCLSPTRNPGAGNSSQGTADDADPPNITFGEVPATVGPVPGKIPARHGDTLTVTVAGVAGRIVLKVDGEGPEFTEISPAHKAPLSSQTVKIRFVVTDSDSGLAHDGELDYTRGDRDARAVNGDDDNFTTGEPRTDDSTGAARDIDVDLDGNDQSASGSSGWRQRGGRPGVSYFLDMAVTNVLEGSHKWQLTATDRAGNSESTDSDPDESGDQEFKLTVDVSSPEFEDARTGISYNADKKTEFVDRSSIAVTFKDARGSLDAVKDIDHSKFLVEDAEVVDVIHLTDKSNCVKSDGTTPVDTKKQSPKDIDGQCLGSSDVPSARIYLQLAEPLAPDATPLVSMFGGAALDLAGNPSNQDETEADDFIAPAITVTLTTDVGDRPVIRNDGEVTINITSDEELRRQPRVWFAEIVDRKSDDEEQTAKLGVPRVGGRVTTVAGQENAWTRTYDNGDIGSSEGLYAVIVIAEDDADNIGSTPGWGRTRTDNTPPADVVDVAKDGVIVPSNLNKVDLGKLAGLLIEIDTELTEPVFALAPETDVDSRETESNNPFITIDFKGEKDEYGNYVYAEDPDGEDGPKKVGGKIKNFGDSHSAVEIVSITLNGDDVSDLTASVSNRKYTLAARDLATGDYELKVTGRDDAGNEVDDEFEFAVKDRDPYELDLIPGWNLVSLPGTPLDSSIQAVMSDSMQASIVLAYQDDAWLTAVNDSGTWRGTLTDIVGGYGYWVQTTAFESISTQIPETDTSSILPTADVIKGWNLLGVVDVLQGDPGDEPSGGGDPDDYFGNFPWKVAYSFDTTNNEWSKSIPAPKTTGQDGIENGKGYWVWSTEAGTLVP